MDKTTGLGGESANSFQEGTSSPQERLDRSINANPAARETSIGTSLPSEEQKSGRSHPSYSSGGSLPSHSQVLAALAAANRMPNISVGPAPVSNRGQVGMDSAFTAALRGDHLTSADLSEQRGRGMPFSSTGAPLDSLVASQNRQEQEDTLAALIRLESTRNALSQLANWGQLQSTSIPSGLLQQQSQELLRNLFLSGQLGNPGLNVAVAQQYPGLGLPQPSVLVRQSQSATQTLQTGIASLQRANTRTLPDVIPPTAAHASLPTGNAQISGEQRRSVQEASLGASTSKVSPNLPQIDIQDKSAIQALQVTDEGVTVSTKPSADGRRARVLFIEGDEEYLTEYQCLLRKQLEVFQAGPDDLRGSTQGRNTPIQLGQVGLRCRHCAYLPLAARTKGAVYYSQTIDGIYQIAQNMSKVHLCQRCYRIPTGIQNTLIALKRDARRATGGKEYWAKALRAMGVYEEGNVLRMRQDGPRDKTT